MQDFSLYLNQPPAILARELARVVGEFATAQEELGASRAGYENAYVHTMMDGGDSVAERERNARANSLHLRVAVIEVEARIEVLRLEESLLRFLYAEALRAQ